MSESEEDIKSNSENETTEVIESEIVETPIIDNSTDSKEPVVIKKGSFLSFVAFILSGSAMTISAYLYMQLKDIQANNSTANTWEKPLIDIKKSTNQKFNQLSTQLTQLQKTNATLQGQLKNIEEMAAKIQPANNSGVDVTNYDDTQILGQIKQLESQLSLHENSLKQIQVNVSDSKKQQNQSLQKLRDDIKNKQQLNLASTPQAHSNYDFETTVSLLQEAHIQLNIYGNIEKSQNLLNKAQIIMNKLSGSEYSKLAQELQNIMTEINDRKSPNQIVLHNQINDLSMATKLLDFGQVTDSKVGEKPQDSSWYDKLIVIRKVDDNKQTKLTTSEQQVIRGKLENHYEMLRIVAISHNQKIWNDEITAIEVLLDLHFSESSASVKSKLLELKAININPELPDLENYLNKFKLSNNTEFTEDTSADSNKVDSDQPESD